MSGKVKLLVIVGCTPIFALVFAMATHKGNGQEVTHVKYEYEILHMAPSEEGFIMHFCPKEKSSAVCWRATTPMLAFGTDLSKGVKLGEPLDTSYAQLYFKDIQQIPRSEAEKPIQASSKGPK